MMLMDKSDEQVKNEIFDQLGIKEDGKETQIRNKTEETEVPQTKTTEDTTLVDDGYTELERQALDLGWKPEGVPGRKNKSAEDWMEHHSFYKKINDLGKQVQEKNSVLENVAKHLESVQEAAYSQAKKEHESEIQYLRQLASDKFAEGEWSGEDIVAAYENDLNTLKSKHNEQMNKLRPAQQPKGPSREDIMSKLDLPERNFVTKYESILFSGKPEDVAVQAYVANRHQELLRDHPEAETRVKLLESELLSIFPAKFASQKTIRGTAPKVETSEVSSTGNRKSVSPKNLNNEEKEIYNYFVTEMGLDGSKLLQQFQLVREEGDQPKPRRR